MTSSSLKKSAIKGTIWTLIGYGGSQSLRFGGNLILTRLLAPELFGLMALVNTFIVGLRLFSDTGVPTSIVRSERGEDPVFLNTAWTIQVIRGIGLWFICLLIAFPLSRFYDEPKLLWLIPLVGLNTISAGFYSTSIHLLTRHLEVGKRTFIDVTTQTSALVIMIAIAYYFPNVWALVIGNITSNLIQLWWSHSISDIRHRFVWDEDCLKELVSFGRWIFVSTAMSFLASQADKLIMGKFFPLQMLGIYTIAFTLAAIPREVVVKISDKVIFPIVSQKKDLSRSELRKTILAKRKYTLLFSAILIALLFTFGDDLIYALYDDRYKDAGWMLPILALGLWPLILEGSMGKVLFAINKPQYNAFAHFVKVGYMILLLPFVLINFNLWWGIMVIGFNDIPLYTCTSYGLWKEGLSSWKQDFIMTILLLFLIFLLSLFQ